MFVRVWLDVGEPTPQLLVPKDALVLGGPAPIVYVVTPSPEGPPTVRPVPVKTGESMGTLICVMAELAVGDLVVTRGNERLRPGQQVVVPGAAPPSPPAAGDGGGDSSSESTSE